MSLFLILKLIIYILIFFNNNFIIMTHPVVVPAMKVLSLVVHRTEELVALGAV